jgi:Zn ribbon nucleic-acid-binding protein
MSGNDEKATPMPYCPKCKDATTVWMLRDIHYNVIGCINYDFALALKYGEFNLFGTKIYIQRKAYVLENAKLLECGHCGFRDTKELFQNALNVIRYDVRRYKELIKE